MEEKLVLAVIAAGSALLGAVIPTIFNYLNNKRQREFEAKKVILKKQKAAYFDLLESMQDMINNQTDQASFLRLQKCGIKVAIYGEDSAAHEFLHYYSELVRSANGQGKILDGEEHRLHQMRMLNSMRRSLGLGELSAFEIIGFHPSGPGTLSGEKT
jgi:hypothetical protein